MRPGPRNLITDVPGILVGNAQDAALKSGVSVVTASAPFVASVAVLGGAPGTRETDLLAPGTLVDAVDALVLSGGSAFGLDAASGVVAGLRAAGRGHAVHDHKVPLVPAAILFDLANGGDKGWDETPYPELGRRALDAAGDAFDLGTTGAGTGATTATLKGGLGSASWVLESGATVGALVAANPVGNVTDGTGRFWAAPFEEGGEFGGLGPAPRAEVALPRKPVAGENTTIAVVATDLALSKEHCKRLAMMAHAGLARAVLPSHTPYDGDCVFAAATGRITRAAPSRELTLAGDAAARCLARAIARAIYEATPAPADPQPTWRARFGGALPSGARSG
ncbi:MAG: P1 family peptidase [Pseudomonadota bacterium]